MTEILAHRAIIGDERENTIGAFLACKHQGVFGVELDVRRTKDGALVVHHDLGIDNVGQIPDLNLSEIPSWVPRLGDALEACSPMYVNVEIKNDPKEVGYDPSGELTNLVVGEVQKYGPEHILVSSFDLATIDYVKLTSESVKTGFLTLTADDDMIEMLVERGHNSVNVHFLGLTEGFVMLARRRGLLVCAWTVDVSEIARKLVKWGVDYVITNKVEELAIGLGKT